MIGKYAVQRIIPLCWRSSGHNRGEKCGPTLTFSLTFEMAGENRIKKAARRQPPLYQL